MSCLTILSSACTLSAPHQRGKTLKSRFASLSLAPPRFVPLRFAPPRFAPLRSAPLRSASLRFAQPRLAFLRFAHPRVVSLRSASLRFAPLRSASPRFAPLKSASLRFAPLRSASPRSAPLRSARCATKAYALSKSFRDQFCSSWILLFDPIHLVRLAQALILMRADLPAAGQTPCTIHPVINVFWVSRCPDNLEQGHYGSHVLRL